MPGKMTKSILRPPFRPPQVLAAVRSSRLSCGKVGKAQIFMSARESSGESRLKLRVAAGIGLNGCKHNKRQQEEMLC